MILELKKSRLATLLSVIYSHNTRSDTKSVLSEAYELLKVAKEHATGFHDNPNYIMDFKI